MAFARTVAASFSVVLVGVLALYPLFVYVGMKRFGVAGVAGVLAVVCLVRLLALRYRGAPTQGGGLLILVCCGGVLLAGVSVWFDSAQAVRYYPVLVNGTLLVVFASSLASPPSFVERLARLRDKELSSAAVVYTRRVTIAWVVFFAVNGAIALYTAAFAPLETWALYNGLIAYLLMGALFGVELLIRSVVLRKRAV